MDDRDRDWRGDRSRDLHDRWSLRRDSSPARYEGYPRKDSLDRERERDRDRERDRERGFGARDREGPFSRQDTFRGGSGRDERAGGGFGKDSYDAYPGEPREPPSMSTVANVDRTNDCEIIVVQKEQREYAEYIEHRLKQIGLTVDLLFPNKEVPIIRVLANISSRGSLYAIVVMPQNEEHRSLTLNILHGQPQEHRNMPLEDAIPLITRNFEAYMRGEKLAGTVPLPVPVIPAAKPTGGLLERHPEAMQVLLNLLSDNRQLTTLQYDRVIIYLKDRREEQMKLELGDVDALRNAAAQNPSPESDSEEDKPSCIFTTKSMAIALHRIQEGLQMLADENPDVERSTRVHRTVMEGLTCYQEIYKEKKCSTKQPTIRAFFQPVTAMVTHEGDKIMSAGEQSTQKQVDLQHRILNILNNCGSGGPAPVPVPAVPASNWPPTSNSGGPTPLLSDPTVQKALDSLMQGNLLRSISSTQSLTTPTYTSASSLGAPPSQPLFGAFSSGGPRRY
uniref:Nuclear receptor coactivator 5 n=1 Tax=Timema shepardi TaxID=629360 RepID=A0A7R9G1S6_TIMSH|nr:unnamed protein product [Timema shepardi]